MLGVNIQIAQYSSGSNALLTLFGLSTFPCWPTWVSSFHRPSVSTVACFDSSLTQVISLTTLPSRFFSFPRTPMLQPIMSNLELFQSKLLRVRVDNLSKTVTYWDIQNLIWSSSVQLSTSYLMSFESLEGILLLIQVILSRPYVYFLSFICPLLLWILSLKPVYAKTTIFSLSKFLSFLW